MPTKVSADMTVENVTASGLATKLSGDILQTVHTQTGAVATGTTTIPLDDTIPQNTEGTEFMTASITPQSAASTLEIIVVVNCGSVAGALIAALFQDSTANALAAAFDMTAAANDPTSLVIRHRMTAGTTSATTFKVRVGSNAAGTVTFNGRSSARIFGGVMASSITIREFKA